MGNQETVIAIAVLTIMVVFKLIDWFLSKAKTDELSKLEDRIIANQTKNMTELISHTATITALLRQLNEASVEMSKMHNRFDEDGTPLWYVPRSWSIVHKEIIMTQKEIASSLDSMARTLERLQTDAAERDKELRLRCTVPGHIIHPGHGQVG